MISGLSSIKTSGQIPISVNWGALGVVGIDKETPTLALSFENVKLGTALELVLDSMGSVAGVELRYEVVDGVVRVSTEEDLNRRTVVRVYDCRDLIDPPMSESQRELIDLIARDYVKLTAPTSAPASIGSGAGAGTGMMGGYGGYGGGGCGGYGGGYDRGGGDDDDDEETDAGLSGLDRFVGSALSALERRHAERAEEFMELIKTHVMPGTWGPEDGVGSMSEHDGLLVIGHTRSGHRQVMELLGMLREAQAARVKTAAPAAAHTRR